MNGLKRYATRFGKRPSLSCVLTRPRVTQMSLLVISTWAPKIPFHIPGDLFESQGKLKIPLGHGGLLTKAVSYFMQPCLTPATGQMESLVLIETISPKSEELVSLNSLSFGIVVHLPMSRKHLQHAAKDAAPQKMQQSVSFLGVGIKKPSRPSSAQPLNLLVAPLEYLH